MVSIGKLRGGLVVRPQFAVLARTGESEEAMKWVDTIGKVCSRFSSSFRLVYYDHWEDPVLLASIDQFDGGFFISPTGTPPKSFLSALTKDGRRFVALERDWTHMGVPSVRLFPPVFLDRLLDHMVSLGYARIDCLSVEVSSAKAEPLIAQWNSWRKSRGLGGKRIDEPMTSHTEAIMAAYQLMMRHMRISPMDGSALFCTCEAEAVGAMRALSDHGLIPGRDVAVCTFDGRDRAAYTSPSLTSLQTQNAERYLVLCMEWMRANENHP